MHRRHLELLLVSLANSLAQGCPQHTRKGQHTHGKESGYPLHGSEPFMWVVVEDPVADAQSSLDNHVQQGQKLIHCSIQVGRVHAAQDFPGAANDAVEAKDEEVEDQHSGLHMGEWRAPTVAGQWKSYQPTHERGPHGSQCFAGSRIRSRHDQGHRKNHSWPPGSEARWIKPFDPLCDGAIAGSGSGALAGKQGSTGGAKRTDTTSISAETLTLNTTGSVTSKRLAVTCCRSDSLTVKGGLIWHMSGLQAVTDVWQCFFPSVNRFEVVDQWLNGLNSRIAPISSCQLPWKRLGHACGLGDGLPIGRTGLSQALNDGRKDCAHARIVFPFAGRCQPISGNKLARTSHKGSLEHEAVGV